jgi:hypothetical protein
MMHAIEILCLRRAIDRIWQRFGVWERREKERKCGAKKRAR